MKKIDRLGWAGGTSFTAYGVRVGVRVNHPALLDTIQRYLPIGWKPSPVSVVERLYSLVHGGAAGAARPGVRRFNLLYGDITRLARTTDLDEMLERFEADLQLYVAEAARRRVFIHAGVVGWRGRAILIPGRSLSGKTTLVAELVRLGATYYSDEYAVMDRSGRVHPFAKPLQVREDASSARQKKYEVEEFGGRAGDRPLPVGLVVSSPYRKGARWRPRRLSAGQGMLELLANTVSARRDPGAALHALQQAAATATALKGVRGEAAEVARAILKRLEE
jgi:hypothetical protein